MLPGLGRSPPQILGCAPGLTGRVHRGRTCGAACHLSSAVKKVDLYENLGQRWLARMARLDTIGAFALTEPLRGSDSVGLESSARLGGDT